MKNCRICGGALSDPVYSSSGMSITSVRSVHGTSLTVYMCPSCFHVQKPALQSTDTYYDKDYRISLESDEFDQLYDKVENKCIYRTDYQAELVLNSVDVPFKARILDYGAGKASTLMKISALRPDLVPYVFDVSDTYKKYWQVLSREQQATYNIPRSWENAFSLVMAHFVLEHVEDPCRFFSNIADLLTDEGYLFFTVPNILTNPGDFIVADHINHFSFSSITTALKNTSLSIVTIDKSIFRGAIVCVAKLNVKSTPADHNDSSDFTGDISKIVRYWLDFDRHLDRTAKRYMSASTAIFGAGVYGSYIAAKIKDSVLLRCFLDNSPHLINSRHMGFPVFAPHDMPEDIRVIYSGLNPSIARRVLASLQKDRISNVIFFDEGAFEND
jgi:2-polyprenyl-3-methyl-5-hydroxy-6-metoxy-1,4-benzoquinol methylase